MDPRPLVPERSTAGPVRRIASGPSSGQLWHMLHLQISSRCAAAPARCRPSHRAEATPQGRRALLVALTLALGLPAALNAQAVRPASTPLGMASDSLMATG